MRGRRARRNRETGEVWQADLLHGDHWESKKPKSRPDDLARRVGALTEGLVLDKVLKAYVRELVLEFTDGTRLFVRADGRLDVSVT